MKRNATSIQDEAKEKVLEFYNNHSKEMEDFYTMYVRSQTAEFENEWYEEEDETHLKSELSRAEILLLTANSVETGILHACLCERLNEDNNKKQIKKIFHGNITYYFFNWGEYNIVHVWAGQTGSHTEQGSSPTIRAILKEGYVPKIVFSIGVAFGIDFNKQTMGDVLVSKKIIPYDKGVKITKGKIEIKEDNSFKINPWLGERIRQKRAFVSELANKNRGFSIRYGNIVTGEFVVDDANVKKIISAAVKDKLIGGEMEGCGVFSECRYKDIPCAVIKGICDWGTGKNALDDDKEKNDKIKDSLQAYAMNNVLQACNILFSDPYIFKGEIMRHDEVPPKKNDHVSIGKYQLMCLCFCFLNVLNTFLLILNLLQNVELNMTFILICLFFIIAGIGLMVFWRVVSINKSIQQELKAFVDEIRNLKKE